jgi:predicted  nucleic acid-binding Zn-ribbon protein
VSTIKSLEEKLENGKKDKQKMELEQRINLENIERLKRVEKMLEDKIKKLQEKKHELEDNLFDKEKEIVMLNHKIGTIFRC